MSATRTLTSTDMRALVRRKYQAPEWLVVDEAGITRDGRAIDMLALNLYASRGHAIVGVEIKVQRGDWLRELHNPAKADGIWKVCHQLYLAAPAHVVPDPDGELPAGWGLFVPYGSGLTDAPAHGGRRATRHEPDPMTRATAMALIAKAFGAAPVSRDTLNSSMQAEYRRGLEAGQSGRRHEVELAQDTLTRTRETVAAFEAASGVRISQYDAGQIGQAVRLVTAAGRHGSGLHSRFWRLYLDAVDAASDLARAVSELEGPPVEHSYRGEAGEALARELYARLREPSRD